VNHGKIPRSRYPKIPQHIRLQGLQDQTQGAEHEGHQRQNLLPEVRQQGVAAGPEEVVFKRAF